LNICLVRVAVALKWKPKSPPKISGYHLFPAAPLWCTNVMPACSVTSVNVIGGRLAELFWFCDQAG